jgi:hypothetical protein
VLKTSVAKGCQAHVRHWRTAVLWTVAFGERRLVVRLRAFWTEGSRCQRVGRCKTTRRALFAACRTAEDAGAPLSRGKGTDGLAPRATAWHADVRLSSRHTSVRLECVRRAARSKKRQGKERQTRGEGPLLACVQAAGTLSSRPNGPRVQLRRPPLRSPASTAAGPRPSLLFTTRVRARVRRQAQSPPGGLRQLQLEVTRPKHATYER